MRFRRKQNDPSGYDLVVSRYTLARFELEDRDFVDAATSAALDAANSNANVTRITEVGDHHGQVEFDNGTWFDVTLEEQHVAEEAS